jgi:hypothetical protein
MAKPRELFNTPAPQAMSLMGAGIADAYARAGAIEGQGYQALGEGIAKGIVGAASAYAGYKQQQAQAKSYEGFLKNPLGQKMLGIDAGTADGYIKAAKDMGGAADQVKFYEMGIPGLMQQNFMMQRIGAQNPIKPAPSYPAPILEESPLSSPTPSPAPSGGMTVGSELGENLFDPQNLTQEDMDYLNERYRQKRGFKTQ